MKIEHSSQAFLAKTLFVLCDRGKNSWQTTITVGKYNFMAGLQFYMFLFNSITTYTKTTYFLFGSIPSFEMDFWAFQFATRGQCIKGKQC